MSINTKQKGARGERMFRDELRAAGFHGEGEDATIRAHVQKHGAKKWKLVGDALGRDPTVCGQRWRAHLDPNRGK